MFVNVTIAEVAEEYSRETIGRLFFREATIAAEVYFRAAEEDIRQAFEQVAAGRRLPPVVAALHSSAILSHGEASRLNRYLKATVLAGAKSDARARLFDLNQNVEYVGLPLPGVVPTLLRGTKLYLHWPNSEASSRLSIGLEYFAIQGLPVFLPDEDAHARMFPFPSLLPTMSDALCRRLAGNAMNLCVVGSIMLFVVATVETF